MKKRVLIIGGVAGGASAAARLRRLDAEAEITIFERGPYISYANCGLPYHVGDVIRSRDALLLQTPAMMKERFNIEVNVLHEVTAINPAAKSIRVKNLTSQTESDHEYDTLIIATGSSPVVPRIPGIESKHILSLWTVQDTDRIRQTIDQDQIKTAVVVGGGFIGIEMAENLRHRGIKVTLVEMLDQVMAPLDFEMAQLLHENLIQNGIDLRLGDGVQSFEEDGSQVKVNLKSGAQLKTSLVILSIGVKPNGELARDAGLKTNERCGIIVDEMLRTSDPNIYAVGDVIEVQDYVLKNRTMIPLAGPANKQGRIAANNIAGASEKFDGTQGSSIVQVFDLAAAATGLNEKTLIKNGLVKGTDYESLIIIQNSHAGYYPGATSLTVKLLFSTDGKKIFGAQIVGCDGVDKRIDTLAVAIRLGAGISDLKKLEFAYAPPYSSAKDPVNMAGFVAENILNHVVSLADWDVVEKHDPNQTILLDVREDEERLAFAIPDTLNIPLGQLRGRLAEIDRSKEIVVFCRVGVRAYNASRILSGNGFERIKIYPGGMTFYLSTHYSKYPMTKNDLNVSDSGDIESPDTPALTTRIDCSGLQCPGPIMKVFETMKDLTPGQTVEVFASDPGFARDIAAWSRRTGNTLMKNEKRGNDYYALVRKGPGTKLSPAQQAETQMQGKTIIVFDGDLDKVIASFIIANGAAAMGRPVTMFFTFWGLNALRKAEKQPVKKTLIESMFSWMMPRGVGKLQLSRMNMGGMGAAMIRKIMKDKNVDSLETMIENAKKAGVKLVACTMSMDLMGIKEAELIDGVELGGVGAYLGDAEESNVNLFI